MKEGIGYKLFRMKKGLLFPLYVQANEPLPMNEWIEAKPGTYAKDGTHVKSKLGPLCYRPGWHINDRCPYVDHIYTLHDGKRFQKENTVWARVKYHTEGDWQEKANLAGIRKGKFYPRDAFLREIPKGGFYRYKTNPTMKIPWIIAGEIYIEEILTEEEVVALCNKNGLEPLPVWKGETDG